jgi:hypothetical protein
LAETRLGEPESAPSGFGPFAGWGGGGQSYSYPAARGRGARQAVFGAAIAQLSEGMSHGMFTLSRSVSGSAADRAQPANCPSCHLGNPLPDPHRSTPSPAEAPLLWAGGFGAYALPIAGTGLAFAETGALADALMLGQFAGGATASVLNTHSTRAFVTAEIAASRFPALRGLADGLRSATLEAPMRRAETVWERRGQIAGILLGTFASEVSDLVSQ